MIRRREFVTLLGGAAAWPLAARAQQTERARRVAGLFPLQGQEKGGVADLGSRQLAVWDQCVQALSSDAETPLPTA